MCYLYTTWDFAGVKVTPAASPMSNGTGRRREFPLSQTALQPLWVACLESPRVAAINVPARTFIATGEKVRRVQTQPGDDGKRVAAARPNRNPAPASVLAVTVEITR